MVIPRNSGLPFMVFSAVCYLEVRNTITSYYMTRFVLLTKVK